MKKTKKTKVQLVQELEALRRINNAVGTLFDLTTVLQRIIDEIVPLFTAQAASVILFDRVNQEAELTTVYGVKTLQGQPLRYPWQGSLAGWVAEHKRSLRAFRLITEEWPTSAKLAEQLGGSLEKISILMVPLWWEGVVIGGLEVVWEPQRDITDGDEQLLETIATQVTIAIANARLFQEKELALQSAKDSEERYRTLIRDLNVGVMLWGPRSEVLLANPTALRMLGLGEDQVLGKTSFDSDWNAIHEDGTPFPAGTRPVPQAIATRRPVRDVVMGVYHSTTGDRIWLLVNAEPQLTTEGKVDRVICTFSDITERKQIEEALQYQLAFEQLIANLSKLFISLAPEEIDTGILGALRIVGEFSRVDRSYLFLFSNQLRVMDNTHEWCAPNIEPMQSRLRDMPTSTFPWLMSKMMALEVIHIPDVNALPPEAHAEKGDFQAQGIQSLVSVPIVSGKALIGFLGFDAVRTRKYWTKESILLLKVVGEIIGNALERQWAAERQQQLQAQLLQAQKLEAIGTLASGVAHDFNNILAAIMGYAELVTDDVPSDSLARSNLEGILTASRRARGLVQQLLTFSRPRQEDRRPIQLHAVIEEALVLLRASLPKNITTHFALRTSADTVVADATQIEQVLMNLCVNAAYVMEEHGGVIDIHLDRIDERNTLELTCQEVAVRPYYVLTVSDNGSGMTPEVLEHIFEPFFTTKPVGQGTGMGLAIVHGIVASHGGTIAVESQLGQGTTFRIYFPACRKEGVPEMLSGVVNYA